VKNQKLKSWNLLPVSWHREKKKSGEREGRFLEQSKNKD